MISKAPLILGFLLATACAKGGSGKQSVQETRPKPVKSEASGTQDPGKKGGNPTFNENDQGQPTNAQNQQQSQANVDPLSLISPELRAQLTPQQLAALSALPPGQLKSMTPDQLRALLQANGGLPGSAVGTGQPIANAVLTQQLMSQLMPLIQQGVTAAKNGDLADEDDEGFE